MYILYIRILYIIHTHMFAHSDRQPWPGFALCEQPAPGRGRWVDDS